MSLDRFFKGLGPDKPHLSRGEIADLRNDLYEAFTRVATEMAAGQLTVKLEAVAPAAGVDTAVFKATVLDSQGGDPVAEEVVYELGVFSDEYGVIPSVTGSLATAVHGQILAGEGTAAVKIKSDANGYFECTLTNLADDTVHVAASSSFRSPMLDCRDPESVTFTP